MKITIQTYYIIRKQAIELVKNDTQQIYILSLMKKTSFYMS